MLLERHRDDGLPLLPIHVDPSGVTDARFFYPDPKLGPDVCVIASLQAPTRPERPLSALSDSEVGFALLAVAAKVREIATARPR
jgi:hypothetical protein